MKTQTSTKNLGMVALIAAMLFALPVMAEHTEHHAIGYVASVADQSFTLRTHSDGVMTFGLDEGIDDRSEITTGNRIQVWFSEDGERRFATRVSRLHDSEEMATEPSADATDTMPAAAASDEQSATAMIERDDDEIAGRTEREQSAANQRQQVATTTTSDDAAMDADTESAMDDERELPRTASPLTTIALIGLALLLAAAWRTSARRVRS